MRLDWFLVRSFSSSQSQLKKQADTEIVINHRALYAYREMRARRLGQIKMHKSARAHMSAGAHSRTNEDEVSAWRLLSFSLAAVGAEMNVGANLWRMAVNKLISATCTLAIVRRAQKEP